MICGLEVGLAIWAIYVLVKGQLTLTKNRVVTGTPARLIALIGFLPLPLSFLVGFVVGIVAAQNGRNLDSILLPLSITEAAIAIGCLVLIYALGWPFGHTPLPQAKLEALLDDYDDDEEDDDEE